MTGCRGALAGLDESIRGAVRFGDGSTVEIHGIGAVTLAGKNNEYRVLSEVYYIPSLKCNIISLGQLEENGHRVELAYGVLKVYDRKPAAYDKQAVLIRAERKNRLYVMNVKLSSPVCLLTKMDDEAWLWHARYGHLNFRALQELGAKGIVEGMPRIKRLEQVCNGCALGKHHRAPFPQVSAYRAATGLEVVHTDLCGQITPPTPGGKSYFLLIVDDHTRYMWVELLASKDQTLGCCMKIMRAAEVESRRRLKGTRTDRGGEFNSAAVVTFCSERGIKHSTTAPYTPQQNGVVERRNQIVVEMARCLLKTMNVPARFSGEAVLTAVYVLNRSSTKSLNEQTPYEAWFGKKPGVRHLRTFGCKAYAKRVGPGVNKLADRTTPGVFLGYERGTKGYRVYDPVNDRVIVSRDVLFDEKKPWNWGEKDDSRNTTAAPFNTFNIQYPDGTVHGPTMDQGSESVGADHSVGAPDQSAASVPPVGGEGSVNVPQTPPHTPISGSLGSLPRTAQIQFATPPTGASADSDGGPRRYRTISDLLDTTEEVHDVEYSGLCLVAAEEPRSVEEAMKEACWRQAMQVEMQSIEANRTWEVSDLPARCKAIGC